jgi:hypothetical protein
MNNKYFSGVGSRATPKEIEPLIKKYSKILVDLGYILRSGGALGFDSMIENSYDLYGGQKEIYLPFPGYNGNQSYLSGVSNGALKLAEKYHPAWHRLSKTGKELMGRNSFICLGLKLIHPSDFILCWTPEGKEKGGTGQSMRIANAFSIPIFNLAIEKDIDAFDNYLEMVKIFG